MTDLPDRPDKEHSAELAAAVCDARATGTPLYIRGGDSKRNWLGRNCAASELDVSIHSGIVDYQPAELVVTARAGTPVSTLQRTLAAQGQTLASEPPQLDGKATLGGTLACNLSGPARPWTGSIRDAVLGIKIINGKGEILNFGGTVMKNVAGYDVSRLQAGALGTLGVLCDISLKVMPLPEHSLTLAYDQSANEAIALMNQRAAEPAPLSGACWSDGVTYLRLSGADSAVTSTADKWGGDRCDSLDSIWSMLQEHSLPFLTTGQPLWRLSLTSTAANRFDDLVIDWAGAQRWVRDELNPAELHKSVAADAGHACLFSGGDRDSEVRAPLAPEQQHLQQRLKLAFDPDAILNRGRLYSWM